MLVAPLAVLLAAYAGLPSHAASETTAHFNARMKALAAESRKSAAANEAFKKYIKGLPHKKDFVLESAAQAEELVERLAHCPLSPPARKKLFEALREADLGKMRPDFAPFSAVSGTPLVAVLDGFRYALKSERSLHLGKAYQRKTIQALKRFVRNEANGPDTLFTALVLDLLVKQVAEAGWGAPAHWEAEAQDMNAGLDALKSEITKKNKEAGELPNTSNGEDPRFQPFLKIDQEEVKRTEPYLKRLLRLIPAYP